MASRHPAANRLATTEISPRLYDCSASIEAVGTPISSLHSSADLVTQRFFEKITWKPRILQTMLL